MIFLHLHHGNLGTENFDGNAYVFCGTVNIETIYEQILFVEHGEIIFNKMKYLTFITVYNSSIYVIGTMASY